jgi:hypothetical protein
MSSVSSKSYLRNFMIDSKVVLYDIFYDTSVNFLYAYLTLYTAGMSDVAYMGVYNTYIRGKCFLSALYKDISCLTPPHSMLLFVPSDSSSHAYATCRSCSLRTDQRHTSCRNTCSVFACAANTRDTAVVFLCKANAVNALLPVD